MNGVARCYDLTCKRTGNCQFLAKRPHKHHCHIAWAYRSARSLPEVEIVGPPLPPFPSHAQYQIKKTAFKLHYHQPWKAAAAYIVVTLWEIGTLNPHISWRQVGVRAGLPDTSFTGNSC